MSHYFIENEEILTHQRTLPLEYKGRSFKFLSNNGLFACDGVDKASMLLVDNMPVISGDYLDLGCGYGVIGIVLASFNEIDLYFADINKIALDYAVKNAGLNGTTVAGQYHSDGFDDIGEKFDHITLNPPIHAGKDVMYKLYRQAAKHLNVGGAFYIVIQKKHGAESAMKELGKIFDTMEVLYKKKGVYVLELKNPRA